MISSFKRINARSCAVKVLILVSATMFLSRTTICRQGAAVMAFTTTMKSSSRRSSVAMKIISDRIRHPMNRRSISASASSSALYSTASSSSSPSSASDQSAMSKSRAPFRMPKNSADDSTNRGGSLLQQSQQAQSSSSLSWNKLGLLTELCDSLMDELKLPEPTPVQSLVIPQLLNPEQESLAFLAATGYVLVVRRDEEEHLLMLRRKRRLLQETCRVLDPFLYASNHIFSPILFQIRKDTCVRSATDATTQTTRSVRGIRTTIQTTTSIDYGSHARTGRADYQRIEIFVAYHQVEYTSIGGRTGQGLATQGIGGTACGCYRSDTGTTDLSLEEQQYLFGQYSNCCAR